MNNLSWLLYLAGVLGNFAGLAIWLGVGIAIASGISFGCWIAFDGDSKKQYDCYYDKSETSEKYKRFVLDRDHDRKVAKGFFRTAVTGSVIFPLLWVFAAAVPPKETIYAIAASEMGEELMKTPTATKAVKALDAWLDKQLAEQVKATPATN